MKVPKILDFNKRQKFVIAVIILSAGVFVSEHFTSLQLLAAGILIATLTNVFLYFVLKEDIKETFYYPLFILPFLYTLSFVLFYSLVPSRLLTRLILTALYAFGLYSLFLSQNIFAVSSIRTITLLRSARIVSFVISILIMFFLIDIIFLLRFPILLTPIPIFILTAAVSFQSLWVYTLDKSLLKEIVLYSLLISLALMQLSLILIIWPINASIYSLFLTGIFYTYSGMVHAWLGKRLFKSVLWEYVWVGFLSILILLIFSDWGI